MWSFSHTHPNNPKPKHPHPNSIDKVNSHLYVKCQELMKGHTKMLDWSVRLRHSRENAPIYLILLSQPLCEICDSYIAIMDSEMH